MGFRCYFMKEWVCVSTNSTFFYILDSIWITIYKKYGNWSNVYHFLTLLNDKLAMLRLLLRHRNVILLQLFDPYHFVLWIIISLTLTWILRLVFDVWQFYVNQLFSKRQRQRTTLWNFQMPALVATGPGHHHYWNGQVASVWQTIQEWKQKALINFLCIFIKFFFFSISQFCHFFCTWTCILYINTATLCKF